MIRLIDKIEFMHLCLLYCKNPTEVLLNTIRKDSKAKLKFKLKDGEIFLSKLSGYWLLKLLNYGWFISSNEDRILTLCKRLSSSKQKICLQVRKDIEADLGHIIEIFEQKVYGEKIFWDSY